MSTFLCRSHRLIPAIRLRTAISKTSNFRPISLVIVQVSALYSSTDSTSALYNLVLVSNPMSLDRQITARFPSTPVARPIHLSTSALESAASVIFPPRYTNSLARLRGTPSIVDVQSCSIGEMHWTSVFAVLIVRPNLELSARALSVSVCRSSADSDNNPISSANFKLLTMLPETIAPGFHRRALSPSLFQGRCRTGAATTRSLATLQPLSGTNQ